MLENCRRRRLVFPFDAGKMMAQLFHNTSSFTGLLLGNRAMRLLSLSPCSSVGRGTDHSHLPNFPGVCLPSPKHSIGVFGVPKEMANNQKSLDAAIDVMRLVR